MVTGLQKYSGSRVRQRGSSPQLVESAVGAHLLNAAGPGTTVGYWRDGRDEVDLVVSSGSTSVALEVKSGRHTGTFAGLDRFRREHPHSRTLIVGSAGIPLEELLSAPTETWLR